MNPVDRDYPTPEVEAKHTRAYPELSQVTDIVSSYQVATEFASRYPKVFPMLAHPEKTEGVVRVIVDNIPVPEDGIPFEQILDFVSDPDSRGRLAGIRRWVSESVRSQLSLPEIEDKLEHELYLFERHMQLHRMKHRMGTFETLVVTSAETLEESAAIEDRRTCQVCSRFGRARSR